MSLFRKPTFHVPNPCPANWDEMEPRANGRFCQQCQHLVVDFTRMTDAEMLDFFQQWPHHKARLCGRFSASSAQPSVSNGLSPKHLAVAAALSASLFLQTGCSTEEDSTSGQTSFWTKNPEPVVMGMPAPTVRLAVQTADGQPVGTRRLLVYQDGTLRNSFLLEEGGFIRTYQAFDTTNSTRWEYAFAPDSGGEPAPDARRLLRFRGSEQNQILVLTDAK